jgi:hypothetical protein
LLELVGYSSSLSNISFSRETVEKEVYSGRIYLKVFKPKEFPIYTGGCGVSEVQIGNVPIPLVNYIYLIRNRKSPYYDIVQHILREMETHYSKTGQTISETVYTINPRVLQEQVEQLVQSEKLTTVNVCRTVLALLYGSSLREDKDFFVTTTSGGRRNYHVKVNPHTMNMLCRFV